MRAAAKIPVLREFGNTVRDRTNHCSKRAEFLGKFKAACCFGETVLEELKSRDVWRALAARPFG
jgi:hypothetical protein